MYPVVFVGVVLEYELVVVEVFADVVEPLFRNVHVLLGYGDVGGFSEEVL